jgi:hypothetical protein
MDSATILARVNYLPGNGKVAQNLVPKSRIKYPNFEAELARRRAVYALRDAGRILTDAPLFFSNLEERKVITQLVAEIQSIERKLKEPI